MKARPDVEDLREWAVVASTVHPLKPVRRHVVQEDRAATLAATGVTPPGKFTKPAKTHPPHPPGSRTGLPAHGPQSPRDVDAHLLHRLARGREALAARIDLHGMTQDAARAALTGFIRRAVDDSWRAVLIITGKGAQGDGVLRRRVPDWLGEAPIREHVAGVSEAHRRHGGEGALYVALKRRK